MLSVAFCGQMASQDRARSNGIRHALGASTDVHLEQEWQLTAKSLQHHMTKSLRVLLQPGRQHHSAVC